MPCVIEVEDLHAGYIEICQYVRDAGGMAYPRGMECREVIGATIYFERPRRGKLMPIGIGRNANPAIGAVEAAQLVGGESHPYLVNRLAPNMAQFMNNGSFYGAYGPRVRPQVAEVVKLLTRDPESRQAVISIFRENDLNRPGIKDIPCTLNLQFMIRGGGLAMVVNMRSNDVWWGLAYDVFQFSVLQATIAHSLGLQTGSITHHVGSLHIYERDVPSIERLTTPTHANFWESDFRPEFGRDGDDHYERMRRARAILRDDKLVDITPGEQWFVDKLHA